MRIITIILTIMTLSNTALAQDSVVNDGINWEGFYIGGQIGRGALKGKLKEANSSVTANSAVGGIHLGYNYVYGSYLVGVEGEANLANYSHNSDLGLKYNVDRILSAQARAGYIFDDFLFFTSAGITSASLKVSIPGLENSDSNNHTGYVLGVGLEKFLTDNISAKIEYQHHRFNKKAYNLSAGHLHIRGGDHFNIDARQNLIRVGVSFHF